ncbi:MAG TPA: hypothetical protein PLQ44_03555 [Candidatus Paceibacterota bacterium]|nr:hypothetical protein [Candidatus Paceibacterota bacterium]
METKYFYQVCNLFSIIEKIIDKEKFTTDVLCELMRGNYDDDFYLDGIHTNYRDEFTTNIYQIQDDKGREAYIKRQISLLGYSSIYEKNKDVLKNAAPYVFEDIDGFIARQNEQIKTKLGISTENVNSKPIKIPAKYDGFLLTGLLLLLSIELLIQNNCSIFNFNYNKLVENAKLRGFEIYDIKKLMGYIFDISIPSDTQQTKPGTNNKTKVKALWKQSKKSLKKLHSLLQNDYNFIDEIDQDVFISHFNGTFTPETPKINWIDEQIVFIRLFDKLRFCINVKFLSHKFKTVSTAELSKHFTINGNNKTSLNLRQSRYTIKEGIDSKKENEISNICKELEKIFSTVD